MFYPKASPEFAGMEFYRAPRESGAFSWFAIFSTDHYPLFVLKASSSGLKNRKSIFRVVRIVERRVLWWSIALAVLTA
jgi:hypothetical protein